MSKQKNVNNAGDFEILDEALKAESMNAALNSLG